MSEAINILKSIQAKRQDKDEFAVFGEEVAIKLRKIPSPHARFMAQTIINNTLFEAEMGKYDGPIIQPQQYHLPSTISAQYQHFHPHSSIFSSIDNPNYMTRAPPHNTPSENSLTDIMSPRTSTTEEDIEAILTDL